MNIPLSFAVWCVALFLAGCTSTLPYRTTTSRDACAIDGDRRAEAAPACSQAMIENRKDKKFSVAYVELTDQGLFHRRDQLDQALQLVRDEPATPTHVVLFVHGWKHSARFDDPNVADFNSRIMPVLAAASPGRTVGIYVGWRGSPLEVFKSVTFYDRKSSADHVARGSLREVLANLRVLRQQGHGKLRVTLIGHSFGGLILFNATSGSLMDSLIAARYAPDATAGAAPVYDLAILLNPAFEASRFEPLFQAAKAGIDGTPGWRWPAQQRPLFVSITSEADQATRIAFPLGRQVNTLLQHEGRTDQDPPDGPYADRVEKQANTHTIGHYDRYRTHRLERAGPGAEAIGCRVVPNRLVGSANHFPLWTMFASGDVMDGHNDIYRTALWNFIVDLSLRADPASPLCGP